MVVVVSLHLALETLHWVTEISHKKFTVLGPNIKVLYQSLIQKFPITKSFSCGGNVEWGMGMDRSYFTEHMPANWYIRGTICTLSVQDHNLNMNPRFSRLTGCVRGLHVVRLDHSGSEHTFLFPLP